ncbi:MAG: bifunctional hydroxymethylpyrimidine kinase/phosphomethylpyrimidine kinase [Rickettsiales bacterium]|nr:bifunctional hydroxymethylpyrimidine kinase/phosphomethylpyrimidine kinase [Rickettsiales bacterium]
MRFKKIKKIMTIAGSDCSCGAGIQADIKTIQSLGGYCLTVLTNITAQNSKKVQKVSNISDNLISSQIDCLLHDYNIDAIKIGLVTKIKTARILKKYFQKKKIPIVIDPIFKSTTGFKFSSSIDYLEIQTKLMTFSNLIIPSISEAELLLKSKIKTETDMINACKRIFQKFKINVLIKGNELERKKIVDICSFDNKIYKFKNNRIPGSNKHGTGCTYSTAVTFFLAKGRNIEEAILSAKEYIKKSIKNAPDFGLKYGPLKH